MEFETLRFDMVWRFDIFDMMSYDNSIFNAFDINGLIGSHFGEIIK